MHFQQKPKFPKRSGDILEKQFMPQIARTVKNPSPIYANPIIIGTVVRLLELSTEVVETAEVVVFVVVYIILNIFFFLIKSAAAVVSAAVSLISYL